MSPTRKEKNKLKQDCQEGSTAACTDLGKVTAGNPKTDGSSLLKWVRMGLFGAFWISFLVLYIIAIFEVISIDFLWLIAPFMLAFGVLMVKGEQEGPHPIALWIAGIIIPLIFGIFIGYIVFFTSIDWVFFTIYIWYIAVMYGYIIIRFADRADARAGMKLWVLLITVSVGIALFGTATIFWYMEIYFELIILFWILSSFLNAVALYIIAATLWQAAKPK